MHFKDELQHITLPLKTKTSLGIANLSWGPWWPNSKWICCDALIIINLYTDPPLSAATHTLYSSLLSHLLANSYPTRSNTVFQSCIQLTHSAPYLCQRLRFQSSLRQYLLEEGKTKKKVLLLTDLPVMKKKVTNVPPNEMSSFKATWDWKDDRVTKNSPNEHIQRVHKCFYMFLFLLKLTK